MPIGGFVIHARPELEETMVSYLKQMDGVEVHGHDGQGNIAAVLEAESTAAMQRMVKAISEFDAVLSIGLTYLDVEDEANILASGDTVTGIFHGVRLEKSPG